MPVGGVALGNVADPKARPPLEQAADGYEGAQAEHFADVDPGGDDVVIVAGDLNTDPTRFRREVQTAVDSGS